VKCVLKNKQRGLLKGWSDANGSWLTKYSKEIVQIAAQQLGVQFGDAIGAAAGLNDAVCFTLANKCKFKLDSIQVEFQKAHAIRMHQQPCNHVVQRFMDTPVPSWLHRGQPTILVHAKCM
jgi:hypothetical protein